LRARRKASKAQIRRAIGYVRVSTEDQAENGVSLDAQKARIEAYALATGRELDEVVQDQGQSAKTLLRPGIARIIEGVRCGDIGSVVVLKLDRLTRSTRDLAEMLELFQRVDAALVSVSESLDTSSAAGRMVVNMLGVVAQWEREAIAESTAFALSHKRRAGKAYGTTPFGYRREADAIIPDPKEQAALQEAIQLDRDGASFREIAAILTERGARPHRGQVWHASSVRAMLRSRIALESTAS
jgi:site-specific DNA recombinase